MDLASMPLLPGARPITGHTTALRTDRMGFVKLITREALPLARPRARFEASAPATPDPHATLRPAGGMPMRVVLRDRP